MMEIRHRQQTVRYGMILDMRKPAAMTAILAAVLVLVVGVGLYYDQKRVDDTVGVSDAAPPVVRDLSVRQKIELPPNPNLLIMGDSYTEGHAAEDQRVNGWAYLTQRDLGWPGTIDGVGGTGWTWGGGTRGTDANRYSDRISRLAADGYAPNVVIFQGGQNDYRVDAEELTQTVIDTVAQARNTWPGIQVIVMGPSAPQPLGGTTAGANRAIVAGARAANAAIINPLAQQWFTEENSPQFAHTDGAHLNTAGHRFLADRVLETLPEIGVPTAAVSVP